MTINEMRHDGQRYDRFKSRSSLSGQAGRESEREDFASAMVLMGLGRVAEAVPYLDAAVPRCDWHLLLFRCDPLFAEFRKTCPRSNA